MPELDEAHPAPPVTNRDAPEVKPFQFTLRTLLIWVAVFALVCGLLAWLWRAIQVAQEAARISQCQCHLKQIGLALLNYHEAYGQFPPAYVCDATGKPMHSWRVLLLPFMDERAMYNQYDFSEPWDGPNNSRLVMMGRPWSPLVERFQCPSGRLEGTPLTNYVAVVGPETMWPGSRCTKFAGRLEAIWETPIKTIMVVEITHSDIHWMEPRDLTFEQAMRGIQPPSGVGISSEHPKGIVYLGVNYGVYFLQRDIEPEELRGLLIRDAEQLEVVEAEREEMP